MYGRQACRHMSAPVCQVHALRSARHCCGALGVARVLQDAALHSVQLWQRGRQLPALLQQPQRLACSAPALRRVSMASGGIGGPRHRRWGCFRRRGQAAKFIFMQTHVPRQHWLNGNVHSRQSR